MKQGEPLASTEMISKSLGEQPIRYRLPNSNSVPILLLVK